MTKKVIIDELKEFGFRQENITIDENFKERTIKIIISGFTRFKRLDSIELSLIMVRIPVAVKVKIERRLGPIKLWSFG